MRARGPPTLDRSRRPVSGPAPKIQLPRFERLPLGNELTLLAVRHDDLPEVSVRLVIPSGAADDHRDRAGTALLTARALTEGTEERSAHEVAQALDFIGARLNVEVTHDGTILSLAFLSRVFDEAIELLAEIVSRPAFEESEVDRLKDKRLDEIVSGRDEPRIVANLNLAGAIFGDHPYGLSAGGVEETVKTLSGADLREFHDRYYRPAAATLVLVGDLPGSEELAKRLESVFSGWNGDAPAHTSLPDPDPIAARRIWAVDWSGPQSELRIGGVGIARLDPVYPAVKVMNSIVGGLFSSRLNMNLREDKGWTYGASSRFEGRKQRGPFRAATAVDAQHTAAAVREMLSEIESMHTTPPTREELELARNALTLSMPRLFETVNQVAARVGDQVIYGLPEDYWERYSDLVRDVSAAEVHDAAVRYLDSDRLAVVVVGPVAELKEELAELGDLEFRDVDGRPASA